LRLTTQKLALRKRRAAFAIVSVALGVLVVVTVNSLMAGVRDVAVKTIWTEEIDPDVVRVYVGENPYEYAMTPAEQNQKAKKRMQFLTESVFDEIRGWRASKLPTVRWWCSPSVSVRWTNGHGALSNCRACPRRCCCGT